ncbi:4a-hydroxytetrahydrobiopterin dehydratase [Flavobacterium sp.]
MKAYSINEIEESLKKVAKWKLVENSIEKKFQFKDFGEALSFIVKVGSVAEKQKHHPEILNVYNKVTLRLNTHDANGITEKDFLLASAIDEL